MEYSKKLKDPRWKAYRAIIVKRDRGRCVKCESRFSLQVHHKKYVDGLEPWEYPLFLVETLCAQCHTTIHEIEYKKVKKLPQLKKSGRFEKVITLQEVISVWLKGL